MFLDEEFHSVCDILKETWEDRIAHPRPIIHTINSSKLLITVAKFGIQPLIKSANRSPKSEWQHIPPIARVTSDLFPTLWKPQTVQYPYERLEDMEPWLFVPGNYNGRIGVIWETVLHVNSVSQRVQMIVCT